MFFIYSDGDPRQLRLTDSFSSLFLALCFSLLSIFVASQGAFETYKPSKLTADTSQYSVTIDDSGGLLGDTGKLEASLGKFKEATGVTPVVKTVYNETWRDEYDSLEDYAYDLYLSEFADETHWLIVYAEPEDKDATLSTDFITQSKDALKGVKSDVPNGYDLFYWEGMQGDDTDSVMPASFVSEFNVNFQRKLEAEEASVADSLSETFDLLTEKLSTPVFRLGNPAYFVGGLIFLPFVAAFAYKGISTIYDWAVGKRYKEVNAEIVDGRPQVYHCPSCGGEYPVSTYAKCPHCGFNLYQCHIHQAEGRTAAARTAVLTVLTAQAVTAVRAAAVPVFPISRSATHARSFITETIRRITSIPTEI